MKHLEDIYLVLGGNGFIGSHVVDKLAEQGKRVRVLDPFRRKPQFRLTDSVEAMKGDAYNLADVDKALKGVTHVFYSLSASNPFTTDKDPYADIDALRKVVEVFEHCAKAGVKKVGFVSSGGAVYGRVAEKKTAHEDDIPLPVSPYGIGKLSAEHYLEYFKRKYGMGYVIFRLSNPYGPRQAFKREQGVVPAFLMHMKRDEVITVHGDGSASRDYIYIEDAANIMAQLLSKDTKHDVYNIGSGEQTSLREIIAAIEKIYQKEATIEYTEAPVTALHKTNLSIDRYITEHEEHKITPFYEGLKKTIQHLDEVFELDSDTPAAAG